MNTDNLFCATVLDAWDFAGGYLPYAFAVPPYVYGAYNFLRRALRRAPPPELSEQCKKLLKRMEEAYSQALYYKYLGDSSSCAYHVYDLNTIRFNYLNDQGVHVRATLGKMCMQLVINPEKENSTVIDMALCLTPYEYQLIKDEAIKYTIKTMEYLKQTKEEDNKKKFQAAV